MFELIIITRFMNLRTYLLSDCGDLPIETICKKRIKLQSQQSSLWASMPPFCLMRYRKSCASSGFFDHYCFSEQCADLGSTDVKISQSATISGNVRSLRPALPVRSPVWRHLRTDTVHICDRSRTERSVPLCCKWFQPLWDLKYKPFSAATAVFKAVARNMGRKSLPPVLPWILLSGLLVPVPYVRRLPPHCLMDIDMSCDKGRARPGACEVLH